MFEAELAGSNVFLAVAQRPWGTPNEAGITYQFSLLKPVLHEDGKPARDAEFPDDAHVWWMLNPTTRALAEPGRIVFGTLEESRQAGTPGKSWYQVRRDSVRKARPNELVEIVEVPRPWAFSPSDLISKRQVLQLDHPPLDEVYLLWDGSLYGPFKTASTQVNPTDPWSVRFTTATPDSPILQIPESALKTLPPGRDLRFHVKVSPQGERIDEVRLPLVCHYRLVPFRDFNQATSTAGNRMRLETDETLLKNAATKLFSRAKRQALKDLLDELTAAAGASKELEPAAVVSAAMRQRVQRDDTTVQELANALLHSGILQSQLDAAFKKAEQEHVEKHAARLKSEIDSQIVAARKALESLTRERESVQQQVDAARNARLTEVEKEVTAKRREFESQWQAREKQLDAQKKDLERQRQFLTDKLGEVVKQLAENREGLITQFLALEPLFRQLHLSPASANGPASVASRSAAPAPHAPALSPGRPLEFPAFVREGKQSSRAVSEADFFERFCRHTEASGFKYRRLDLAAFHLSVKCNDLSVLGGQPGTGKSSLPRLYAEALAGEEYADGMKRFLHVGVSPSWLDMRDLLGHVNALDHCFQPAEAGLYQLAIWAQEEDRRRGPDSRLYLVCLDEMNLAHVEHYFSGFLQALERPPGHREVRCFSPELVHPADPFVPWATLSLPRTLRFVGTVNFDETTRQLSQRVLDRCNLIRLQPGYVLDGRETVATRSSGPAVTARQFTDWVKQARGLDRSLAEILDRLKEPLAQLGSPLNPRRFQAICTVLGSTPAEICKPEQALDLQIAERILPQIRHLFRPGARTALDAIRKVLETSGSFEESLRLLDEIQSSELAEPLLTDEAGE